MSLLRNLVKQETKTSGYLLPSLDKYLESRPPQERRGGFHPSELSYNYCPRELAALRLGVARKKKNVNAQLHRIFDNGHYFHDRMQRYAREMNIVLNHPLLNNKNGICEESQLDHPCGLTGNTDNILELSRQWYVTDYKSTKNDVFSNLVAPLAYHERQVVLYMGMLKSMIDVERPLFGLIVYENKDTQQIKEFRVEWNSTNREYFDKVVHDLELVNESVRAGNHRLAPCSCGKCPI